MHNTPRKNIKYYNSVLLKHIFCVLEIMVSLRKKYANASKSEPQLLLYLIRNRLFIYAARLGTEQCCFTTAALCIMILFLLFYLYNSDGHRVIICNTFIPKNTIPENVCGLVIVRIAIIICLSCARRCLFTVFATRSTSTGKLNDPFKVQSVVNF